MPVPIFEQPELVDSKNKDQEKPAKEKFSVWAMFLALVLLAVLVVMAELAYRDSNKLFNPYYDSCQLKSQSGSTTLFQSPKYPKKCEVQEYEQIRLLLHTDIAIPVIIISILIFMFIRKRKLSSQAKIVLYAYLVAIIWIAARLIIEAEYYVLRHNELLGKYLVLFSLVIIVTLLVVLIQKKFIAKFFKEFKQ